MPQLSTDTPTPASALEDIEAQLLAGEDPSLEDEVQQDDPEVASAIKKGWKPKADYTGDPSKWVDAATFNERGDKFSRNLQRQVEALQKELASHKGTLKQVEEAHAEALKKKDQEIAEAIRALRIQKSQALSEGEHETVLDLEDRIDALKGQKAAVKEIPPAAPATPDPATQLLLEEWVEDGNSWFKDDPRLRDYAIKVGDGLIASGETLRGRKFLDKVAGLIREEFPRRFKESAGKKVVQAESGSNTTTRAGARATPLSALSAQDRQVMNSLIASGLTTQEKFLADFASNS